MPLVALVAGRRRTVEEAFQTGKSLTGLDEHQVRRWISWRRWTILAMLAHAFLLATDRISLSQLTCNKIRHLLAALLIRPAHAPTHVLG